MREQNAKVVRNLTLYKKTKILTVQEITPIPNSRHRRISDPFNIFFHKPILNETGMEMQPKARGDSEFYFY